MKKFLTILLLLTGIIASAQSVPDNLISRRLKENPHRAGLNIHNYEFAPLYDTPAPKGYKPFYISHYGRHGARTSSDGHEITNLQRQLEAASAQGALTADGEYVLGVTRELAKRHLGMNGHLTKRGRWEHKMLAQRMYKRYPAVFRKGSKKIFAASSTVPRCIVSMNSFTNSLVRLQKDLDIDVETGEVFKEYIAKGASKAQDEEGKRYIKEQLLSKIDVDTMVVLTKLLKDPEDGAKYFNNSTKFTKRLFAVARSAEALGVEDDLFRFLPEDFVYYRTEAGSMQIYFCQANCPAFGNERLSRNASLVRDIIERADEAIEKGEPCADLRFGHDWPFLGLVSYFGLEGVSARMDLETARNVWDASLYTPFAANMQIIFYKAKGKDILVKFLMNEKETLIPELTAVQGPYYKWDDVKSMCAKPVEERFN